MKMTREQKVNWWIRLACGVALFRVVAVLVTLLFSMIVYVLPRNLFWWLHSFEPILGPALGTCATVWFTVQKVQGILQRPMKIKVGVAILCTGIALCPVYLKRAVSPVDVSPLETAIQDGYSDDTIQIIINKTDPRLIDGWNFRDYPGFSTPLQEALYAGRTNVVRMLLRRGANPQRALKNLEVFNEPKYEALIKAIQDETGTTNR